MVAIGILLLVAGVVLFFVEAHVPTHGVLGAGALAALVAGVVLLVLAADALRHGLTARRASIMAVVGTLAVWVSHPSVFVLAGAGHDEKDGDRAAETIAREKPLWDAWFQKHFPMPTEPSKIE